MERLRVKNSSNFCEDLTSSDAVMLAEGTLAGTADMLVLPSPQHNQGPQDPKHHLGLLYPTKLSLERAAYPGAAPK